MKKNVKKLGLVLLLLLTLLFALTLTCAAEEERDEPYAVGAQIELYLNAPKNIRDLIGSGASSVEIADTDIVERSYDQLVPRREGVTYVSYRVGDQVRTHTVVVHKGAQTVAGVTVEETADVFAGYVGQTYAIATSNSSGCDTSDLYVTASAGYHGVRAEELISIGEDGTVTLIGVGEVELCVRSATNRQDRGAKIKLGSSFQDPMLAEAVARRTEALGVAREDGVYTSSVLFSIEELTLDSLSSFDEREWQTVLPALREVTVDLRGEFEAADLYRIGAGTLAYRFLGAEDSTYTVSISADAREYLQLSLQNVSLSPTVGSCLDLSAVTSARVELDGVCTLRAGGTANPSYGVEGESTAELPTVGDGGTAIRAQELELFLADGASVGILGGDGNSVVESGTRNGGGGISVIGTLTLSLASAESAASLLVCGGKGDDGMGELVSGGCGGIGIRADALQCTQGRLALTVVGGDGGFGGSGFAYSYSDYPSTPSKASGGYGGTDGTLGAAGGNGGDGGTGGIGLLTEKLLVTDRLCLTLVGGNGGDGGGGGKGQRGGNGGDGGDTTGWGGANGGKGGKGGNGGAGGNGGRGAAGGLAITAPAEQLAALAFCAEVSLTHGYSGIGGYGGDGGDGGNGGDGGDDKHGGVFFGAGEGPVEGAGGERGSGGDGGLAGVSAESVTCYGIAGVQEEIAPHFNPREPANGRRGFSGYRGDSGDPG